MVIEEHKFAPSKGVAKKPLLSQDPTCSFVAANCILELDCPRYPQATFDAQL